MSVLKLPVSLAIITFNEEKNIQRCIESVPFASEVVVLDSFSKDKTQEICKNLDVRFIQQTWLGYGKQKKLASQYCSYDWVLSLDADEELSTELKQEIIEKWNQLDSKKGYKFPRISFYLGQWIRFGGWYPDYQLRLFHKTSARWNESEIHERVEVKESEKFKSPINHYVFSNISDHVITNDKYSSVQAEQMNKKNQKYTTMKLLVKPISKFVECYFLKLGFRDGLPGLIIAVGASYSAFLKWAKLWEIEQDEKKGIKGIK